MCAIAFLLVKLFGHTSTIGFGGVELPVTALWLLFIALTVAHAFVAYFLMASIQDYLATDPLPADSTTIFEEVRAETNPFLHGLLARVERRRMFGRFGTYVMAGTDPSAWVARAAELLLLLTLLPWHLDKNGLQWASGWSFWWGLIGAMLITELNWIAGSTWIVSLSRLNTDPVAVRSGRKLPVLMKVLFGALFAVTVVVAIPLLLLAGIVVVIEWLFGRGRLADWLSGVFHS